MSEVTATHDDWLPDQWYPLIESRRLRRKPLGLTRLGERMVLWRDATGGALWDDPDDVLGCKPIVVIDTGFLVNEDDNFITITPCIAFDNDEVHKFARWICIPKGCIESMHKLPLKQQKRVRHATVRGKALCVLPKGPSGCKGRQG